MELGVGEELIEQYVVGRHAVELGTTSALVDVADHLRVVDGDRLSDEVYKYSLERREAWWRQSGQDYLTGMMHDRGEERLCPLRGQVPTIQTWTAERYPCPVEGRRRDWRPRERRTVDSLEWDPNGAHVGLG
jgi:hypothetical protein